MRKGRRRIDQQQRPQAGQSALISPELQRTQAMLFEIPSPVFASPHPPLGLVGQDRRDRVRRHGPGREDERLRRRRIGACAAIVRERRRNPEVLLEPLPEDIVHERPHSTVRRRQRRVPGDCRALQQRRSSGPDGVAQPYVGARSADPFPELLLQVVVPHEVEQIRGGFPVLDDSRRIQNFRHLRHGGGFNQIFRGDAQRCARVQRASSRAPWC